MNRRRLGKVVLSIAFMLIVFSAFALRLFARPGVLLVVDARYREACGPDRVARALLRARLTLWRPVEELVLDDTARPDMISALVASKSASPALVAFGFWLSSYAQVLHDSPNAPPVVILGGSAPHPDIPTMTLDHDGAYRALASSCASFLDTSEGPVLLVADPAHAQDLLAVFHGQEPFLSFPGRVGFFDPAAASSPVLPAAVIIAGGPLTALPEAWSALPLAVETVVAAPYLPDTVFALVDSSIYNALPFLNRFEKVSLPFSYPARLVKP